MDFISQLGRPLNSPLADHWLDPPQQCNQFAPAGMRLVSQLGCYDRCKTPLRTGSWICIDRRALLVPFDVCILLRLAVFPYTRLGSEIASCSLRIYFRSSASPYNRVHLRCEYHSQHSFAQNDLASPLLYSLLVSFRVFVLAVRITKQST